MIIRSSPVQQKFISVAAVSFGEGGDSVRALAHTARDSAAPTSACASPDTSRSANSSSLPLRRRPVQYRPAVGPGGGVREERAQAAPQLLLGVGLFGLLGLFSLTGLIALIGLPAAVLFPP